MEKQSYLSKSRYLLLFLFALIVGSGSAWADGKSLPYSYGFEDYPFVDWTMSNPSGKNNSKFVQNGTSKKTGSYGIQFNSYDTSGENAQYLISPELNAPNGGKVTFYYKNSNSGKAELFKVGYSTTDNAVSSFTWGDEMSKSNAAWEQYEGSFPAGTKYVAVYYYSNYQYYLYVDDFSFTAAASGPALEVADGSTSLSSGCSYNFGLTTAGTTKEFKLSNPGTESITLNIEATNGFGVSPTSTTIAAKGEETLTVTMANTTASGAVTITPEENVDPFTINVSGTVRDPNKVYLDFANGQMPEGWTQEGYTSTGYYSTTYEWTPATGYIGYSFTSSTGAGKFISPKLNFENGETIIFETQKYSNSAYYLPSVTVEYTDRLQLIGFVEGLEEGDSITYDELEDKLVEDGIIEKDSDKESDDKDTKKDSDEEKDMNTYTHIYNLTVGGYSSDLDPGVALGLETGDNSKTVEKLTADIAFNIASDKYLKEYIDEGVITGYQPSASETTEEEAN